VTHLRLRRQRVPLTEDPVGRPLCVHALRTTAATNVLEHAADIAFVQK
jgi:hypothetical protein